MEHHHAAPSDDATAMTVRSDRVAAHQRARAWLARSGAWLDASQRLAVAAEVRQVRGCQLCAARKAAVSPFAIDGVHDGCGPLPATWTDIVHRIVSDPGRLTRGWYERTVAHAITDREYVEVAGVIATITAVDTFARGLGATPWSLPEPVAGAPSRHRPKEARHHQAWVPHILAGEQGLDEADFFQGQPANIRMALTLVPDEARGFFDLVAHQYIPGPAMNDFGHEYRAITHAQIELLAGRVSAINQCTY